MRYKNLEIEPISRQIQIRYSGSVDMVYFASLHSENLILTEVNYIASQTSINHKLGQIIFYRIGNHATIPALQN